MNFDKYMERIIDFFSFFITNDFDSSGGRVKFPASGHRSLLIDVSGKVSCGQEPPSGESTTTECGVNYQLLAVMY